jgi:hypothetical protein
MLERVVALVMGANQPGFGLVLSQFLIAELRRILDGALPLDADSVRKLIVSLMSPRA